MSSDMTIESALSDPMIRAIMRADRVEPQAFERLLNSAAKALEALPRRRPQVAAVARPLRPIIRGFCCA